MISFARPRSSFHAARASAHDLESGETLRVKAGTIRHRFAPNDVRVLSIR